MSSSASPSSLSHAINDIVLLRNLQYKSIINNTIKDLLITTKFQTDFSKSSETDDLKYSINYAVVSRNFKEFQDSNLDRKTSFLNLIDLANSIFENVVNKENEKFQSVTMDIVSRESNYNTILKLNKLNNLNDKLIINDLSLSTIIGLFTFERFQKQPVKLNIDIEVELSNQLDIENIVNSISKYIENSNFKTVEALVSNVNKVIYKLVPNCINSNVEVLKTNIIEYCDVGVSSELSLQNFNKNKDIVEFNDSDLTTDKFVIPNLNKDTQIASADIVDRADHFVYVAFGSNVGHQLENINQAINELNDHPQIQVLQTSSLYKSKPMYFLNQPDFINGCLKLKTNLTPHDLLKFLKIIEYSSLHRVKEFNNGPRTIDLDIILYDSIIVNSDDLNVPHISMVERSFVLFPLCELLPSDFIHPVTAEPIHEHLRQLMSQESLKDVQESSDLISLIPLRTRFPMLNEKDSTVKFRYLEYDLINSKTPTQLMSILNITPDSFSDGSKSNLDLMKAMEKVDEMVANNVDIIDIGGCSTRPGSKQPPLREELNRVIPVVKEIKKKYGDSVIISIDTYRSKVAEEAIKYGADIINDISAGTFDDQMYDIIAKYNVPYVVNHTRGDISTMYKLTNYTQTDDGENIRIYNTRNSNEDVLVTEVSKEISKLISKMYSKGIKRWQIILDPGLGFAKNLSENLSIIRNLPKLKHYQQYNLKSTEFISFKYIPILLGPSRKKFIGTITGKETAAERINGTSASITAGIGFGSDIVRVHDFKEMKDVCLMGDAIYKNIH